MSEVDLEVKADFATIEWDEDKSNLLIRDAICFVVGKHKPSFEVTEEMIDRVLKYHQEEDTHVRLFLSHDEKEATLIGVATDFNKVEADGRPAISCTLYISDKELAMKIENLKKQGVEDFYGLSPRVSWTEEEDGIPKDPKFEHIALVLHPAQGDTTKIKDEDKDTEDEKKEEKEKITCPECGETIEVKKGEKVAKCPKCGAKIEEGQDTDSDEGKEDEKEKEKYPEPTIMDALALIKTIKTDDPDIKKKLEALVEMLLKIRAKRPKYPYYPKPYTKGSFGGSTAEILQVSTPKTDFQPVEAEAKIFRKALFKKGTYHIGGTAERPVLLRCDDDFFRKIIENFKRLGSKVPAFIGHPTGRDLDVAKTVAWVIDLEYDGEILWGVFEFVVDEVAEAVEREQILGVSVGYRFDYKTPEGEELGTILEHVALTAYPKLKDLLKDKFEKLESYVAAENVVIFEVEPKEFAPEREAIELMKTRVADLEKKLGVLYKKYEAEKKKIEDAEMKQLDELLDNAIAEGKITPAQKEVWRGIAMGLRQSGKISIKGEEVSWLEAVQRQISLSKGLGRLNEDYLPTPTEGSKTASVEEIVGMTTEEFINFLEGSER